MFVLDASIAVAWAFADEEHPVAASALALLRNDEGFVPSLWWFEIRNVLIVNERRGRLRETDTALFLRYLGKYADCRRPLPRGGGGADIGAPSWPYCL